MAATSFKMVETLECLFANQKRNTKLWLQFSKSTAQILKNKAICL